MSKTHETGHAKNAANFEQLISFTESLGATYNPSVKLLHISALELQLSSANKALNDLNAAKAQYSKAIEEREAAFSPLKKLLTRVGKAIKISEASDEMKQDAKSIMRKLKGRRAKPKLIKEQIKELAEKGITKKQVSASQQSFDNRIENLDKLVKLLELEPAYAPNETELQTASLKALHGILKAKNTAALTADPVVVNARSLRNTVLYNKKSGMVDIALDVKDYIQSIKDITEEQLKTLSKIKFINHKE